MRKGQWVIVAATALSLGTLACGFGGFAPSGEVEEVQEQVEAVQEQAETMVEEQAEAVQGQAEEQGAAPDAGSPLMSECPVVTAADIQAATGMGVAAVQTVEGPEGLLCSIAFEDGIIFQIQVMMAGGGEGDRTGTYESLVNQGVGEGVAVDGPWEVGMYFPKSGLIFRAGTNVVLVGLGDNQNGAVQIGSAVAGRLPYTVGG